MGQAQDHRPEVKFGSFGPFWFFSYCSLLQLICQRNHPHAKSLLAPVLEYLHFKSLNGYYKKKSIFDMYRKDAFVGIT
jgi:hypothetical protein